MEGVLEDLPEDVGEMITEEQILRKRWEDQFGDTPDPSSPASKFLKVSAYIIKEGENMIDFTEVEETESSVLYEDLGFFRPFIYDGASDKKVYIKLQKDQALDVEYGAKKWIDPERSVNPVEIKEIKFSTQKE